MRAAIVVREFRSLFWTARQFTTMLHISAGLYVGLSSSAAFFVLRELGFRPHIPPAPEVPQGASFLQMVSHAGTAHCM
jgi:hypothetical protein